jgi:zinc transporter
MSNANIGLNAQNAQQHGVLWCYILEPKIDVTETSGVAGHQWQAQAVSLAEVQNYQGLGYVWVNMQSDEEGSADSLAALDLSTPRIEALCALDTRPKAQEYSDGMLVYLRGINRNPDADPEDMVSLRLWVNERKVITLRRKDRSLISVDELQTRINQGDIPASPMELMVGLINQITDIISETVDDLDEQLSQYEELEKPQHQARMQLSLVRRQAAAIRRFLAPQRDALDAITRVSKHITEEQIHDIRLDYDRTNRYVDDLDLAKERAVMLQEEMRNQVAEQQGMRMYVLSLVTAVFLPLSFLTGLFGMNVAGLPGTENPAAFDSLALAMVIIAGAITGYMVWRKWM